jgi:hypothetical protein
LLLATAADIEALKAEKIGSKLLQEIVQELTLKIGEKIDVSEDFLKELYQVKVRLVLMFTVESLVF